LESKRKNLIAILLSFVATMVCGAVLIAAVLPSNSNAADGCCLSSLSSLSPEPVGKNCAAVGSCGAFLGCKRMFGGGSQYTYNNNIPACLVNNNPRCFDVICKVRVYASRDCTGEFIDEAEVDRRGCRRAAVPPSDPY